MRSTTSPPFPPAHRACDCGRRFYDYDEKGRPQPSAKVQEMIVSLSASKGVARRALGDEEIVHRLCPPGGL